MQEAAPSALGAVRKGHKMALADILSLGWVGIAAIVGSLFLGGILKGVTGIGAAIASVPVMAALTDLRLAVVVMLVPGLVTNLRQAVRFRQPRPTGDFLPLYLVAVVAGVVVGSFMLVSLPDRALEALVAVMVLAYVAFRIARPAWQMELGLARRLSLPSGFAAGVLQGATGIAGPAVVAFLNAMRPSRVQFLGTIAIIFLVFSVAQITTLSAMGLFTLAVAGLGVVALGVQLVGIEIGVRLAARMRAETFDRVILTLLVVIALKMLVGV